MGFRGWALTVIIMCTGCAVSVPTPLGRSVQTAPATPEQAHQEIREAVAAQRASLPPLTAAMTSADVVVGARRGLVQALNDLSARHFRRPPARGAPMAVAFDALELDVFGAESLVVLVRWRHVSDEGVVEGQLTQIWRGAADGWRVADEQEAVSALMTPDTTP